MIRTALAASALALALGAPFAAVAQPMSDPPPPGSTVTTTVEASPPVPNPPPSTTNNNPNENADPGYMGAAHGAAFRDIDQRIAAMETQMAGNRAGLTKLRAIKSEEATRRARHGGELRDWDRELLNKKLDALGGPVG